MKIKKILIGVVALTLTATLVGCSGTSSSTGASESAKSAGQYGDCNVAPRDKSLNFKPAVDGQLTVAVPLPSPNGYFGDTPETVKGGYMYCMAADIASRVGLPKVVLKNTSFENIVTGRASDYDIAIWNVIITPEREKAVEFSKPYMTVQTAAAVRAGQTMKQEQLKDAQIGVLVGSFQETLVNEKIKPTKEIRQFQTNEDMFAALAAGQVDVVLQDFTALMPGVNKSKGQFKVVAMLNAGGKPGVVMPKGSPNKPAVDAIVDKWLSGGDLNKIFKKWLNPVLGLDPKTLPVWKID